MRRADYGTFVCEDYCRCGAVVDRLDDGISITYTDPDTGERVTSCPNCGRGLNLLGQAVATSRKRAGA